MTAEVLQDYNEALDVKLPLRKRQLASTRFDKHLENEISHQNRFMACCCCCSKWLLYLLVFFAVGFMAVFWLNSIFLREVWENLFGKRS